MLRFWLKAAMSFAHSMLRLVRAQAKQDTILVPFIEALEAGMVLGERALSGQYITRTDIANVRKEFNEALDALEPLLPPG